MRGPINRKMEKFGTEKAVIKAKITTLRQQCWQLLRSFACTTQQPRARFIEFCFSRVLKSLYYTLAQDVDFLLSSLSGGKDIAKAGARKQSIVKRKFSFNGFNYIYLASTNIFSVTVPT